MARFNEIKNSFLAGEVSPRAYGRTDLPVYRQGCKEITNAVVYPQGGVSRRPGSLLINSTVVANSANTRLIPLSISTTEAYMFIFTDDTFTIDGSSNILTGVRVLNCGTGAIGTINYAYNAETRFTRWRGYYLQTQLNQLKFAQRGTTLFLSQQLAPPFCIEYLGTDNFRVLNHWAFHQLGQATGTGLASDEISRSFPYEDVNVITANTMTASAISGTNVTITLNSNFLQTNIVGSVIKLMDTGGIRTGVGVVKGQGALTLTVDVMTSFYNTSATSFWSISQWNAQSGYPRAVAFHELRLYYGGNTKYPSGVWGSQTGNVAHFVQQPFAQDTPNTITNASAYSVILSSGDLNQIQWLSAGKALAVGTSGREFVGTGPDETLSMGPLNVSFSAETSYGSVSVQPARVQNTIMFVQRSGEKIREFTYNFQENSYKSIEVSQFAEHMVKKQTLVDSTFQREINLIVGSAHQEADEGITWFVDLTGALIGVTRDRDLEVSAFHSHYLGGTFSNFGRAKVMSIATAPSVLSLGNHDDLWLTVKRVINGVTKTFVELLPKEYQSGAIYNLSTFPQNQPVYCDSAIFGNTGAFNIAAGNIIAAHLPNTLVEVVIDGQYLGRITTNSAGNVILPDGYLAHSWVVGLPYQTRVQTLPGDAGSVIGTAQGQMKRFDQIDINFNRTVGARFGPSFDRLQQIEFRQPNLLPSAPIEAYTGLKSIKFGAGYTRDASICLEQDLPMPFQVSSVIVRGTTND